MNDGSTQRKLGLKHDDYDNFYTDPKLLKLSIYCEEYGVHSAPLLGISRLCWCFFSQDSPLDFPLSLFR